MVLLLYAIIHAFLFLYFSCEIWGIGGSHKILSAVLHFPAPFSSPPAQPEIRAATPTRSAKPAYLHRRAERQAGGEVAERVAPQLRVDVLGHLRQVVRPELPDAGELQAQRVGKADPLAGAGAAATRGPSVSAPGRGRASPAPSSPLGAPEEMATPAGPAPGPAFRFRFRPFGAGVLGQARPGGAVVGALVQAGDVAQVARDVAGGQR